MNVAETVETLEGCPDLHHHFLGLINFELALIRLIILPLPQITIITKLIRQVVIPLLILLTAVKSDNIW